MGEKTELKACPLCGEQFVKSEFFSNRRRAVYVHPAPDGEDSTCPARSIRLADDDPSQIAAWNTRPQPAPDGWRPIETAPRDAAPILAGGGGMGAAVGVITWNERVGCWDTTDFTLDDTDHEPDGYNRPTHWMPLPAPPVSKAEG